MKENKTTIELINKLSIDGYEDIDMFLLIDNLSHILTREQVLIIINIMKGYTYKEISKMLKKAGMRTSPSKITIEMKKIRQKIKELLRDEKKI